jgi:hypothetical protein
MGRHHQTTPDRQLEDFAKGLRDLRRRAGNPSYQKMAAESGYSGLTLSAAASGRQLPPLTVTLGYVTACGGDAAAWADRWRSVSARLAEEDHASLLDPGETDPIGLEPVEKATRRKERVMLLVAGLVTVGLTAGLLLQGNVSMPIDMAAWWAQEPVVPPSGTAQPGPSAAPGPPASSRPDTPTSAQSRATASSPPRPAAAPAPSGPPPEYRAVAGPGCPMDFTRQTNVFDPDGWLEVQGGGSWTGDGCTDRFLYSALTSDPTDQEDTQSYFQWRFLLNGPAARQCQVEVYVPDSPNASAPIWYDITDRFDNVEANVGRFMVDQAASQGSWQSAAMITVDTDSVLVQIGGDGRDLPPGHDSIAAGPVRLTCYRR